MKHKKDRIHTLANTLVFINEKGVAITCRHVAEKIQQRAENKTRILVKERVMKAPFIYSGRFRFIHHPEYDLSIMVAQDLRTPLKNGYARFLKDSRSLKPGRSLCLMGYPISDFTNFWYNDKSGDLEWTNTGKIQVSEMPVQGMLTRLTGTGNKTDMFEMYATTFPGHSGSPVFNQDGLVCGMLKGTAIFRNGQFITTENSLDGGSVAAPGIISQTQFSYSLHVEVIKDFLKKNRIKYYEG